MRMNAWAPPFVACSYSATDRNPARSYTLIARRLKAATWRMKRSAPSRVAANRRPAARNDAPSPRPVRSGRSPSPSSATPRALLKTK